MERIKLTFRKDKNTKEIIAVYQDNYSYNSYVKVCYVSNGGHSSISKDYYRQDTKPAKESEYKPLLNELVNCYSLKDYVIVNHIYWNK